jgi:phosphate acetyltransferase
MNLLDKIHKQAKKNPKRIVFPESSEERILKACDKILKKGIAKVILLGNKNKILNKAKKLNLNIKKARIIDHLKSKTYTNELVKLRKSKGMTIKKAKELLKDENYFGTMMVHMNHADGLISGAIHTTADTVLPALQIIKTKEEFHRVSGLFLMLIKDKVYLFADCAININPDAKTLAEIAIDSEKTAKRFGIRPRIAMLSFSSHGSGDHKILDKIRNAVKIVQKKEPKLKIDGELQVDAALDPEVCKIKAPNSKLKGNANVLIFPDLNVGNISYKLVERLGNAEAIGPILQGLQKPINDLSRGCKVKDIVNLAAITVVEAQK